MKKIGVALALGAVAGFALGWATSPGPFRYFYRTTSTITLIGPNGVPTGTLPPRSFLVSDMRLLDAPDLGWWAYVPVRFDNMRAAAELGVTSGERVHSIMQTTLAAAAAEEIVTP